MKLKIVLDRNEAAAALVMYLESRGYTIIGNPQLLIDFPALGDFRVEAIVEPISAEASKIEESKTP